MTTIAAERQKIAAVGLVLRRREQWGAKFNYTNARNVTEPATQAFCHISVTDPDNYADNDAHARGIEKIGIARFPATGISYNGLVLPGGRLYEGQPWGRRGAHTVNDRKRAVCSQSGCPSNGASLAAPDWNNNIVGRALVFARNVDDPVTDADVDAAGRYWAGYKLAGLLHVNARIHGHRCCAAKDCPGGRVWSRIDDIADATVTHVRNGLRPKPTPPPPASLTQEDNDMQLFLRERTKFRAQYGDRYEGVPLEVAQLWIKAGVKPLPITPEYDQYLAERLVSENPARFDEPAVP